MRTRPARAAGLAILGVLVAGAALAPVLAPHRPGTQHADLAYAPPMPPRVRDADGRWRAPFIYPLVLEDRLTRRFGEDRARPVPLVWLSEGRLVRASAGEPWLLLGADPLGRDVFSRLLHGARVSLGIALLAGLAALALGAVAGASAGFAGGRWDDGIMRVADFVVVLPAIYVVLVLRAAMPLVLSTAQVFWTMTIVFAAAGWPYAARGVRAIVAAESRKEYAEAALAAGAGPWRILLRHLLPASRGYLAVQGLLLLPAFILAEATLSFVGLGFPEPNPSWGLMLQDAGRARLLAEAPWLAAPAVAIVLTVLSLHLVAMGGADRRAPSSGGAAG